MADLPFNDRFVLLPTVRNVDLIRSLSQEKAVVSTSELPLGNFSISLTVKDVQASKEFYEKLGFKVSGGDIKRKYVIMQNATSTIGLYQGMFEKNSLTYNPGWDRDCKTLPEYQDVRALQQELKKRGLTPVISADEKTDGPPSLCSRIRTAIPS